LIGLSFVSLSGCSLLFVAKGKTGMAAVQSKAAPKAKSLSKKMDKDVIRHKVEEGETLAFLGKAYYGSEKLGASRIARTNHLKTTSKLKKGTLLSIVSPLNFPSPRELSDQLKNWGTPEPTPDPKKKIKDVEIDPASITQVARPKVNQSFAAGEKLVYEVKALSVVAGTASLEVDAPMTVSDRPCYPLTARAKAAFPFSAIYPVKDVQTSYFDSTDFLSWKFENDVSEGDYRAQNKELYDQVKHRVWRQHDQDQPEEMDVPPFTQDIISCFYYFRLLPVELGKKYSIPTCSTGKNYNLVIDVVKREKVTIPIGTFDCYLVKPYVKHNTVFRNEEDIDLWITADSRHVPVLVKSGIVVGSIEITLMQATLPQIPGVSDSLVKP
jgi:hypothetical protein